MNARPNSNQTGSAKQGLFKPAAAPAAAEAPPHLEPQDSPLVQTRPRSNIPTFQQSKG